jgi:hypothetical protein
VPSVGGYATFYSGHGISPLLVLGLDKIRRKAKVCLRFLHPTHATCSDSANGVYAWCFFWSICGDGAMSCT